VLFQDRGMAKVTVSERYKFQRLIKTERGTLRWYVWLFLLFIALFLQSKVMVFGIRPEFLSVPVFIFGMRTKDDLRSTIFGATCGFFEDILSGFWGPNIMSKALIGYLSANILGGFFVWSPILGVAGLFFITAIDALLGIFIAALKDSPVPVSVWVIYTIFMQSLINSPLGIFAGETEFKEAVSKRTGIKV
jgi:hypothetical protein